MAWQTVNVRIKGRPAGKPGTMALVMRRGQQLPSCVVTCRQEITEQIDWPKGAPVGVQIGSEEHAGLIRIFRCTGADGVAVAKAARIGHARTLKIDLGHLAQLGPDARAVQPTDVTVIGPDVIELRVPAWGDAAGEDAAEATAAIVPSRQPRPQVPSRSLRSAPLPAPKLVKPDSPEAFNGVAVDFAADSERVLFEGGEVEVTTRQARLVAQLARAMPNPIDHGRLIASLWAKAPTTAPQMLAEMARDLAKALAPIGLVIRDLKNVGIQLARAE